MAVSDQSRNRRVLPHFMRINEKKICNESLNMLTPVVQVSIGIDGENGKNIVKYFRTIQAKQKLKL